MELLWFTLCYIISGIFIGLWCAGFFGIAAAAFLGAIGGLICAFAGVLLFEV